ncbi:TPA: restriction endonuclease subunit S [Vibrio parahaemolyticus]|nr:restriction endonuclease subunit S [Vibrio parahaemolyticus]
MTGRYKAYTEYKDSDVDWLHDIPTHWKTIPVGRCYRRVKRTGFEKEELLSVYRDHGVVPKSSRDDNNNKPSDDLSPYQLVCENNLVMNKMKAWQGSIAISEFRGIVSPAYFVYEPMSHIDSLVYPKYVHYLLRHPIYITQYMSRSKGIRVNQWDLDPEEFQRIELLLPQIEEQKAIISFLDHETAKIDTLITKQEKLIELLKEKRQAVISHAVTKGLNPDAPMKGSGVEWLGEVPEHWFVVPIKRMCEVKDGTHDTPKYVDKGENSFPLITSKDFEGKNISFENAKYISKEAHREIVKRSNTEVGDVLMSMIGGNIGKALIVKETAEFSIKNVALFKTTRKSALASYILYYLESGLLDIQISLQSRGGAQGFLSLGDLRNLVFFKVPEDELHTIVEHLDLKISKYDRLINIASDKIALLSERKTALISAAVTGKINVRDWQPSPTKVS